MAGIVHTAEVKTQRKNLAGNHTSGKYLRRYVTEFAGKYNVRELDTIDQMAFLAKGMVGKRLSYKKIVEGSI